MSILQINHIEDYNNVCKKESEILQVFTTNSIHRASVDYSESSKLILVYASLLVVCVLDIFYHVPNGYLFYCNIYMHLQIGFKACEYNHGGCILLL